MQTEYFVVMRAGPSSYPLVEWDEFSGSFYKGVFAPVSRPIRLRLGAPVPRAPVMVDYHSLPDPVVSERLKDVLEPLDLHGVQLVPADVKVTPDDVRRYWMMHVYNEITCIDRQRSLLSIDEDDGDVLGIKKLVLDEEVLRGIPLEKRRVFALAESVSTILFHQSVMEPVMALKPEGVRFLRADLWNDGAGFRP
ncbi:imm11 family protein [Pyxidicoccus sp. 3LG]